jgi:acetyltransferase EpsM
VKIVMIGQGGHSKVIRDIILENKEYHLVGYLDDSIKDMTVSGSLFFGPIFAAYEMIRYFKQVKFVIAIGNNVARKSVAQRLGLANHFYITLVHKTAIISPGAKIGHGTVVMANAVINAEAQIGHHAIINTGSVVEHDNKIDNFTHISPHATLTGGVTVGEGAHIGAGAVAIPNVKIGEWSTIGAGATVINDIPSHCTAVGTPAKIKIKLEPRSV